MNIFENVQAEAGKKNMSIYHVERKAGLAKGTIYRWKKASPTVSNLKKVADALGVKIEKLIKEGRNDEKQNR